MDLKELQKPFAPEDIEWRVARSGIKSDGKPWAQVLAYVTSRAIMDRLDEVCGPENWGNQYKAGPNGGVLCGIEIRVGASIVDTVTKWDGADNTEIEGVKGGLSGAFKRAAVHWGIGRYLYNVKNMWAVFDENGSHSDAIKIDDKNKRYYKWNPPELPSWALPEGTEKQKSAPATAPKKETVDETVIGSAAIYASVEDLLQLFAEAKDMAEVDKLRDAVNSDVASKTLMLSKADGNRVKLAITKAQDRIKTGGK